MFLIGTDEAGYGPNLGPLIISATLWEIPDEIGDDRLYKLLRKVVCRTPADSHAKRVAWGDSKDLYQAGQGIGQLERGMLAALALGGHRPREWRQLWHMLEAAAADELDAIPWHDGFTATMPLDSDLADLEKVTEFVGAGLERAGIRLRSIVSRALFPAQFNRLLTLYGNKAEVLSRTTLELVSCMLDRCGDAPARVICDKHGGRNRYSALLQQQFTDWLIEVRREGAVESYYAWGLPERRIEIRFREKCEEFLPVALASMASKYLREAAMLAFNHFWQRRIPELRSTAGYPGDSRRFKEEIGALQAELGIDDCALWRPK